MARFWHAVDVGSTWAVRVIWASLLWFLFVVAGLVVGGLGPATAGLFTVVRGWILGRAEVESPWRTYRRVFRQEFWPTNALFWVAATAGVLLGAETLVAIHARSVWLHWVTLPLLVLDLAYGSAAVYMFPLYVHRRLPTVWRYAQWAWATGVASPGHTVIMLALVALWVLVLRGLLPLLGLSGLAWALMRVALDADARLARRLGSSPSAP
jgi:uncharacterized membrane protein YesL